MAFIPKTKDYTCDIGTFKMLQGVPFRVNLLNKIVTANDADDTIMSSVFRILEGYLYEFVSTGDSDIKNYIEHRAGLGLQERFDLMGLIIDFDNYDYIMDSFLKTRDNSVKESVASDEDEQAKKNESLDLSKEQSPAKVKAAS